MQDKRFPKGKGEHRVIKVNTAEHIAKVIGTDYARLHKGVLKKGKKKRASS